MAATKHPASPDPFPMPAIRLRAECARPERTETLSSLCFFEKGKYFPTHTRHPHTETKQHAPPTHGFMAPLLQLEPFFTGKILTTPHSRAKNTRLLHNPTYHLHLLTN